MERGSELSIIQDADATRGLLTRREIVARLLAGIGAGAAWPMVAAGHPIRTLLANGKIFDEAEKLAAGDWKPLVLSAQQDESFVAMAERIVPGSTKAQVNRFVDLLLSIGADTHKKEFVAAIETLEAASQKQFGKGFPALDAGQQDAVLSDAAAQANGKAFDNLKGWVTGAYYSSEIGMRELGWSEDRVFERFPGCEHPEGHH